MTILRTPRLTLRPPRDGDLDGLFAVYSDPRAMAYWSSLPDTDRDQTRARLREQSQENSPRTYFVIDRNGLAIGNIGMHHAPEIGFILHPDHWRQGLMSEALTRLIPHLFDVTDVRELTADVDPRNTASLALLQGQGFAETGRAERTFCIGGVWVDSIYLTLERPQSRP